MINTVQINAKRKENEERSSLLIKSRKSAEKKKKALETKLSELKNKNSDIIKKAEKTADFNTDFIFAVYNLLLCGLLVFLLFKTPLFKSYDGLAVLNKMIQSNQGKILNVAFLLIFSLCIFFLTAKKKKIFRIFLIPAVISGILGVYFNFRFYAFVFIISAVVTAVNMLLRKIIFEKGKYNNIFQLLSNKGKVKKAYSEIYETQNEIKKLQKEIEVSDNELLELNGESEQLELKKTALEDYKKACILAADYPNSAVKAYNRFVKSYFILGETGQEFFELRSKMENEEKDNLFKFALEFCEDGGDPYEFLRILQLSLNKGCEEAKTLLGKVFAQISAAARNGEYEKAYSLLQPLIEAGSADALNIKLQLDNNQIAMQARLTVEKARKEAFEASLRQNAMLSAAQQSVLREMTAIRQNQEFAQALMLNTIEDARFHGIKIKF